MAVQHNTGRRTAIGLMVAAAVVFLVSLWVVLVYNEDTDLLQATATGLELTTWITIFAVVLGVILVAMLLVLGTTRKQAEEPLEEPLTLAPPELEGDVAEGMMLLKCGHCANTFEVSEMAERPFYSTCPHCGARGVLNY